MNTFPYCPSHARVQVTYVVVDNLCWPKRAKISVREELVTSVRAFKAFWLDELTVFATEVSQQLP